MTLPDLSNWDDTRNALHQSLQVLRAARLLGVEPLPNELEYSTIPTPTGASTGPLNFGGELRLDFVQAAVIYARDGAEVFRVALDGHSQTSLFDAVFAEFERVGHRLMPDRKKITETVPFALDKTQAATYAGVMWRMYGILARVKAHFYGPQTPLVLWPHGFDLSTVWFVDGMDEHRDPQMNFGFSPGTPDIGQPYFYFYAWPVPGGLPDRLPPLINWNSDWSTPGGFIRYDQFAGHDDPDTLVMDALVGAYNVASGMLKAGAAG